MKLLIKKLTILIAFLLCLVILGAILFFFNRKEKKVILINVLEKEYYDDVHIAESIHIPFQELFDGTNTRLKNLTKETTIVFYCSNYACSASGEAATKMAQMGFLHSYAYEGGMTEWFNLHKTDKQYKIIGMGNKPYLTKENNPINSVKSYKTITAQELLKLLEE